MSILGIISQPVLEAFPNVVPEKLTEGNSVELGDFGSFRVSVSSEGEAQAEDVTARNITDIRVLFTPGKRFKQVLDTVQFQKESAN